MSGSPKDLALRALDAAAGPGVDYADVRAVESRDREVATKNGKVGYLSRCESQGVVIRVLVNGCCGVASTDDLSPEGIERAAALALDIARAGQAAPDRVVLAPETRHEAVWVSPSVIDPFSVSIESNL